MRHFAGLDASLDIDNFVIQSHRARFLYPDKSLYIPPAILSHRLLNRRTVSRTMPPQLSVSQWIALSEKYVRSHAPEMASGKANTNLFNLDVWHLGQSS